MFYAVHLVLNTTHDSQVKLLIPDRIQVLRDSFRSLLHLSDLYRHVGITGSSLVFADQALCTYHCKAKVKVKDIVYIDVNIVIRSFFILVYIYYASWVFKN